MDRGVRRCGVAIGMVWLALATTVWAVEPAAARIAAQLAAGEFAPVFEQAQGVEGPARDEQLSALAAAQRQAGAIDASVATLAQMQSSAMREQALVRVVDGLPGGGAEPDFTALTELIQSTVSRTSWSANGGAGEMRPFQGGVRVEADGALRRLLDAGLATDLAIARHAALHAGLERDVRRSSSLRKISLPRLERAMQLRRAAGEGLDEPMLALAGLQRVRYVFVDPDTRELVIAGPAGDWQQDREGRWVSFDTGRPLVMLEDLVTLLPLARSAEGVRFGCSITPTREGLARVRALAAETTRRPLRAGQSATWIRQLREALGPQTVDVYGVAPTSRVAQVIVEADYRMKLVGLGLEPSVLGLSNYLERIEIPAGGQPPPLDVLRWWFTMRYDALAADADRLAFEIRGQGVLLKSENELLTEQGERVHTGQAEQWNREFAASFTQHFPVLAAKYPIYAELQNVFDVALVAALCRAEGLAEQCAWSMAGWTDGGTWFAPHAAPRQVDSVAAERVVGKIHVLAAISGGVEAAPAGLVKTSALTMDRRGTLSSARRAALEAAPAVERWWWD